MLAPALLLRMRRFDPLRGLIVSSWTPHRTPRALLVVLVPAVARLLVAAAALAIALLATALSLLVLRAWLLAVWPPLLALATLSLAPLLLVTSALASILLATILAIPSVTILDLLARGRRVASLFHVGHPPAFSNLLLAKFLRRGSRSLALG